MESHAFDAVLLVMKGQAEIPEALLAPRLVAVTILYRTLYRPAIEEKSEAKPHAGG